MTQVDPFELLGIPPESDDGEIRAAYLAKVREFPPDRAPQEFEKVRDAYEILRDPRRRTARLLSVDPRQLLPSLFVTSEPERRYVGPEPWLAVLRERKG